MPESQFISHTQVIPTLAPRRSTGVFSALVIVLVVLIGSLTLGLVFLEKNFDKQVKEKEIELGRLKEDFSIPSLIEAQKLQGRIEYAEQVLGEHVYGSQPINFLEAHTVDGIHYKSFQYSNGVIKVSVVANGYLPYAEEIKHLRGVQDIKTFAFGTPQLDELTSEVTFSMDITLTLDWLHSKPARIGSAAEEPQPDNNPAQ